MRSSFPEGAGLALARRFRGPFGLTILVASLGAGCGGSSGAPPASPATRHAGEGGSRPGDRRDPEPRSGDGQPWASLPELPQAEAPGEAERQPPDLDDVEALREALRSGFYAELEGALPRFTKGSSAVEARLVEGRLWLATGRYDEAAKRGRQLARSERGTDAELRAKTLEGEALTARGKLAAAEAALRAVTSREGAHRARWVLGRVYARQGRRADAERLYYQLIGAYNDATISMDDAEGLTYVALAARGLGAYQDANEAFQQATRADPDRVETQLAWAQMFLEKYDAGHAEESVRHALERNPNHALARALMGRIRIEQSFDFQDAAKWSDKALEVNPKLVLAHVTRAGMALRDRDIDLAHEHLDRALGIDPRDLEALSVRAAVRFIAGDDAELEQAKEAVLDVHPSYSRMYTIIGDFADWEHRYPEMVNMARSALALEPRDAKARAMLGINLLRQGEEALGLEELRKAFRNDPFNVRVYNTLNLYDDVIPQRYEDFDVGPFVFRMHEDERPILERYVPRTLQQAYEDMVTRYGMTPEGPLRFELFADAQHFAMRTTGLPRMGVQGVCFGKVVTAISPGAAPLNWGQITWHELAHVFHIQLSKNRVPRWFTEGLAEYEAGVANDGWKREMDHLLYAAIEADRLPPIKLLNRAFTHARSAEDMMTAYYAATRVVIFLVDEFGFDKIVAMLREWSKDRSTPEVVERALGLDIDTLDERYRRYEGERLKSQARQFRVDFARYTDVEPLEKTASASPDDAGAQAAYAAGLLVRGKREDAARVAKRALELDPDEPLAHFLLGRMAIAQRNAEVAQRHLTALLRGGHDGYDVRMLLARLAFARRDPDAARQQLAKAARLDPERTEAWVGLARVGKAKEDRALQIRALSKVVELEEHDRSALRALLGLLVEAERWSAIADLAPTVGFLDPFNADAHAHVGRALLKQGEPLAALYEYETALAAKPQAPGPVHLGRARALVALGRRDAAKEAATAAVEADESLAAEAEAALAP